ncbi:MAG: insulinase family protein [Neisseriaceae bacterium]|nr:insulinase family protein [Neisseriaceae bacterium]
MDQNKNRCYPSPPKQVLNIADSIESIFPSEYPQYPIQRFPEIKTQKIVYTKKINNKNNAIIITYYSPSNTFLENRFYNTFLRRMLQDSFFHRLRTEKQLGYTASVSGYALDNIHNALIFFIESPNTSPKALYQNIQAYYAEALATLESMSDKEFNQFKTTILKELQENPGNTRDEINRHYEDFELNNTNTPIFKQLAEQVENTNKQEIIHYFKETIMNEKEFVLISEVAGKQNTKQDFIIPKGYQHYDSLEELHKSFTFSPLRF